MRAFVTRLSSFGSQTPTAGRQSSTPTRRTLEESDLGAHDTALASALGRAPAQGLGFGRELRLLGHISSLQHAKARLQRWLKVLLPACLFSSVARLKGCEILKEEGWKARRLEGCVAEARNVFVASQSQTSYRCGVMRQLPRCPGNALIASRVRAGNYHSTKTCVGFLHTAKAPQHDQDSIGTAQETQARTDTTNTQTASGTPANQQDKR